MSAYVDNKSSGQHAHPAVRSWHSWLAYCMQTTLMTREVTYQTADNAQADRSP